MLPVFKVITMKKSLLLLAAIAMLVGCGNKPVKQIQKVDTETITESTTESVIEDYSQEDFIEEEENVRFTVENYTLQDSRSTIEDGEEHPDNMITFSCDIDIPVTDNEALRDSICYWLASQIGSDYDGNPSDVKAMMSHYRDRSLDFEGDEGTEGYDLEYSMKLMEANDRYVTYRYNLFFESAGSPRANQEYTYVTFDSSTGTRFTRQMILVDDDLKQLVMNGLFEQYFSEWRSEDLPDLLFFDPDLPEDYGFFLPQYDEPWIFNDYIYFGYSVHEIADRCTGQPRCGLSYSEMEPYLTEEGKTFF